MADVLKVTPEELRTAANTFKSKKEQMQTAYGEMQKANNTLDTSWNGQASDAFKTQFESMYKNLSQAEQKMSDAVEELEKAAGIYDDVEQQIESSVKQLQVGTSPFA